MGIFRIAPRIFIGLLVFGFLAATAAPAAAQTGETLNIQITQVDTSAFPTVRVYVSVTDGAGEPVPIQAERIMIVENGAEIRQREVTGIGDSQPLTSLLVLDLSGSMGYAGKLPAAKSAAEAYVAQMRTGEQAGLLSFNTQITYVQPITADRDLLTAAIENLQAQQKDTALYDALVRAEEILQGVSGRKAVIVLTDGMNNSGTYRAEDVISRIGPAGLSISTIGLGEPSEGTAAMAGIDEAALKDLAARAGGVFGYANDPSTLQNLYEKIGRALHSEYMITYQSPAALRDGLSRSLQVRLAQDIPAKAGVSSYNPGGLVPEVTQPASWPLFFSLLAVLIVLLFVPGLIRRIREWEPSIQRPIAKPASPSPRVKLKEPQSSRIKLH